MPAIPSYIPFLFLATTALTLFLFLRGMARPRTSLLVLGVWLLIQGLVSASGFYTVTDSLPPRLIFALMPPLLLIAALFFTEKGRGYIDGLDSGALTLMHIVRVPVEFILMGLFLHGAIPEIMTFEGRNFDIFSGLTAPLVWYFGYVKKRMSSGMLIAWNLLCLGLVLNVVINGILSTPFPFQQFAFDQPNIAILHFPYVWLPACIVPLVVFAHLVSIRQLLGSRRIALQA